MSGSTFKTNPISIDQLLKDCESGKLQLPDFQRSWVWDEDRIKSLLASISRAFPIGALMTLDTGGEVEFKPRPIEGAPDSAKSVKPQSLLLDGQQRLTSLFQVTLRNEVVSTITPRKKRVKRWFYIDIAKSLDPHCDRESAIVSVPEDRVIRADFGRRVELDLSDREHELTNLMYPCSLLFRWADWQKSFIDMFMGSPDFAERWEILNRFYSLVVTNFTNYDIPVISLGASTSKEAVCVVFEKVNTGGKPLDAFELITAMYAADGYELRKDWYGDSNTIGRSDRFRNELRSPNAREGILAGVGNTDFLHVISLFHTRDLRRAAESQGKSGRELPQIIGNRAALLSLPLDSYRKYQHLAEDGFLKAAKFLHMLHIFRVYDLPYQSQIIPLAAILAEIGDAWEYQANRAKIEQWFWNGVFGELYGSSTETRIARDFVEVPAWLNGGPIPTTINDAIFRSDRLETMRMRLSAAYKGVNALLMVAGAQDFRSGQRFAHSIFFDDAVDIHHIFPQSWCQSHGIDRHVYDSIVNKSPLSARSNRIIGGEAPSKYLKKIELGDLHSPGVQSSALDDALLSHLIEPSFLRTDDFHGFFADRKARLVSLIEGAIGKSVYHGETHEEDEDFDQDDDHAEAELILAPA